MATKRFAMPHPTVAWQSWESVAVDLSNVPKEANTFVLWDTFRREGSISSIDIFEDSHGRQGTRGRIRFRPPPKVDFWSHGPYMVRLPSGRLGMIALALNMRAINAFIPSPVRKGITYPAELELHVVRLDIGVLVGETTPSWMRTFGEAQGLRLLVNLRRRDLQIFFKVSIRNSRPGIERTAIVDEHHDYRIKLAFLQLSTVHELCDPDSQQIAFLITLNSPPIYHRQLKDFRSTFTGATTWKEADTWYRQTAVVHNPYGQSAVPTNLRRSGQVIDIGGWNVFKITYANDVDKDGELLTAREILKDYNVSIVKDHQFTESAKRPVSVWQWIDHSESEPTGVFSDMLHALTDQTYVHLPFPVRYQLEVCLSNGNLNEYTMTRDFVVKLAHLEESAARSVLEHVAAQKTTYYNPTEIFNLRFKGKSDSKIAAYCCYMRTARVTPSTIYYNTPTVDISNRVVRHYIEHADRFLRVRFTDEKTEGRINSTVLDTNDEIFTRIKRTMSQGIKIGDRHYEFLAFGNSQFREHGAYFFAPLSDLTAATIRAWMGEFHAIRNIARYAARLGQCFSTTRPISGCPVTVRRCQDIVRHGYKFSDGVGKISKFLAQMAMTELKIKTPTGDPPSAFQFRLGGSKGMLAISPDALPHEVHIRPSQYKFDTGHGGLEIIRLSQLSTATLNRQLILVLSALGVPDNVFHARQDAMVESFSNALNNDATAASLLQKYIDPNQTTLIMAQMVADGFKKARDPFISSLLELWKAWHLKSLKEKAKIVVDRGANLLGIMDETGCLKGYYDKTLPAEPAPYDEKVTALPEIFVQICPPGGAPQIITGICLLARNPSLHPGDIRLVRAVDKPELHELRDVVILPQTGDRDVASMCSGGDLDGDDYLVIWDLDMVPETWFTPPMDYTGRRAPDLDHDVTVDEVTSFFVTYMKHDYLPMIAHAHMAWADQLDDGVCEEKCLQLAQLHSDAVDYNKSGRPAHMTRDLSPRMWPHFMEKRFKRKEQIYHSKKILGQLYDKVKLIQFVPSLEMPFDSRILKCSLVSFSEQFMEYARELKEEYDSAMRRIMAQYEIKTEFEVWSTFVLSHGHAHKDYKLHEDLGRIVHTLRSGFCQQCYDKVGGRTFEVIAPLVVAMYRVTQDELEAALAPGRPELLVDIEPVDENLATNADTLPLISFPWMFSDYLGKIALGRFEIPDPGENMNSLPPIDEPTIFTHAQVMDMLRGLEIGGKTTPSLVEKQGPFDDAGLETEEDTFEDAREGGVSLDTDEQESEEVVDIMEEEGDVKSWLMDKLHRLGGG
ncbi:hypothetical protein N7474_005459 [Penicillium riverlandense]|uniref:uncharacterized protein n=1 Tax=Penicillium riverlandense TaxID=1903569 RepID=UPI00254741B6|nr:uncharacterized protein N7474_005459 [Penicillium riverlandense]KAJ5819868.1 hypothetical protein N7474_005459 [Penicillium riverlandense]